MKFSKLFTLMTAALCVTAQANDIAPAPAQRQAISVTGCHCAYCDQWCLKRY